jgi:hypothetical protein
LDFGRLGIPQRFEELCKLIVKYEYPDAVAIDGRGGDEGTDSFIGNIGNQKMIFQFKFFPGKVDSSQRKKIEKSLAESLMKKPSKWILLVPANFTMHDWKWWEALKKKLPTL